LYRSVRAIDRSDFVTLYFFAAQGVSQAPSTASFPLAAQANALRLPMQLSPRVGGISLISGQSDPIMPYLAGRSSPLSAVFLYPSAIAVLCFRLAAGVADWTCRPSACWFVPPRARRLPIITLILCSVYSN
jgi:hypothetical protein